MDFFRWILRKFNHRLTLNSLEIHPDLLKAQLASFFQQLVRLRFIPTDGCNAPTFFVEDSTDDSHILGVVKVASRWRDRRYKRVHGQPDNCNYYLAPAERFQRESRLLEVFSRHALAPYPLLVTPQFFAQEYLPGIPLRQQLEREDVRASLHTLTYGFEGLQKIHELGYYHGDASIKNTLWVAGGVKFIDFEYELKTEQFSLLQMQLRDYATLLATTWMHAPQEKEMYIQHALHWLHTHLPLAQVQEIPRFRSLHKKLSPDILVRFRG